ncbi:hypothetical protein [Leadbettera azotonutricia]|uniref:Uncharacterized protein n=1 Tax=Leadbettera azotonutricia (strain ATCC BAA-888 / DSM 13862 / ZAS-9) TaxID=545695 RepID=F5YEU2_LEAAZ|nr:hypothetical protein [Leadbettera azotonutricia]AEF80241.1 conserved hypothetical protein [Leadbettera azotonutricia ZAS-9]
MAIQPIDLQALFTQVDKVGKLQANQREGLQIQQALQQADSQKKAEEQVQSVNEAQGTGEEAEKIKDGDKQRQYYTPGEGGKESPEEADEEEEKKDDPSLIRDPSLGRNIDISG